MCAMILAACNTKSHGHGQEPTLAQFGLKKSHTGWCHSTTMTTRGQAAVIRESRTTQGAQSADSQVELGRTTDSLRWPAYHPASQFYNHGKYLRVFERGFATPREDLNPTPSQQWGVRTKARGMGECALLPSVWNYDENKHPFCHTHSPFSLQLQRLHLFLN